MGCISISETVRKVINMTAITLTSQSNEHSVFSFNVINIVYNYLIRVMKTEKNKKLTGTTRENL